MREIKFRGKPATQRLRESEELQEFMQDGWLYGWLIGTDVIVGKLMDIDSDGISTEFWCRVDPATVGECTGQPDKNGKEIYEGDVFGNIKALRCVVERQANGAYELVFLDKRMGSWSITDPRIQKSEVIGNLTDTPDLLGGERRG